MRLIHILLLLASSSSYGSEMIKHSYVPEDGFIPNQETAIAVAVAVWEPIYGAAKIDNEKPYIATLSGDVWYVRSSLPKGWRGGVAEAEISKTNGTILRVSHGK